MNKNQLIVALIMQELKNISLKDWLSIIFSGAVVILTFFMWRIRHQDFVMKKLRTSCRNFLDLYLKNWLEQLEKIIAMSKDRFYGEQLWFDIEKRKFYLNPNRGYHCPKLLEELSPELEQAAPKKLKKEFSSLNEKIKEFNEKLSQLRDMIENLANKCLEAVNNDSTIRISMKAWKLEDWPMVYFILDVLLVNYISAIEKLKSTSIDKAYKNYFGYGEFMAFIKRIKEILKDDIATIINMHRLVFEKAGSLDALLKEKKQELSVKYYIPIRELQDSQQKEQS